jgi:vancomycin permeability regulator SanA
MHKKTKKRIFIIFGLPLLWFLIHAAYITIDGRSDNGRNADVAVVLGSKVNEDGTLSERLTKRMECALELYNAHRVKKLIVSGGLGKEGFYEGSKMKEFLVNNGVPGSDVAVDNHGDNTIATVDNSLRMQDSLGFKSVIVVSQYFHITRTKMMFRNRGIKNVSGKSPDYYEIRDIYSILREFAGYYTQS